MEKIYVRSVSTFTFLKVGTSIWFSEVKQRLYSGKHRIIPILAVSFLLAFFFPLMGLTIIMLFVSIFLIDYIIDFKLYWKNSKTRKNLRNDGFILEFDENIYQVYFPNNEKVKRVTEWNSLDYIMDFEKKGILVFVEKQSERYHIFLLEEMGYENYNKLKTFAYDRIKRKLNSRFT